MDPTQMTDERIMAYADGELPEDEARTIERAAENDPEIRRKIDLFARTRARMKEATGDPAPVPDALARRIAEMVEARAGTAKDQEAAEIVPLPQKSRIWHGPAALAACLTLVVGLAAGLSIGQFGQTGPDAPFGIAALADPEVTDALSAVVSGQSRTLGSGAVLNVIASFADAGGGLCREFDYAGRDGASVVAVACHDTSGWTPKIAITTSNDGQTGYAPASSLEALDAWLAASGLGTPLSADAEARRLEGLPQ
ncbi:MAG: hypothetical protein JJ902_12310 [Roseibium sp.]|nr:hypothetical protein [Roseibium sp.]